LEESLGALIELRDEGKIARIGLSNVSLDQLRRASELTSIVSVQNRYNLADRSAEAVLDHCAAHAIAFIPWFPLATGRLAAEGSPLRALAQELGAGPSQLALAWLLRRSPVMLPIPGTSSVAHLEENVAAAGIALSEAQIQALSDAIA
jgi:pyridoxine 4-dehydrogenase